MKTRAALLVMVFFLLLHHNAPAVAATPSPNRVVITPASFSEREGALFVAQDHGLFRKYDLDVQLVYVSSGAVAVSALAAGESHFYYGSASGATLGAVAGGLDAVFVAGLIHKLTGALVVTPEIKSPSELKGKRIGITSIGGGNWMYTMLAFDYWGLDPKRDGISFRVIGNNSVRAQSITSGVIDGSVLSYTFASRLKREGYRILADLSSLDIPYQDMGLFARRSFVNQFPDVTEKALRALAEAITFIQEPANRAAVMRSMARWLRLPRVEDAADGYEFMQTLYDRRIHPSVDGLRNTIRVLGITNEKIRRLKAEDLADDRFVKKLEKDGLFR